MVDIQSRQPRSRARDRINARRARQTTPQAVPQRRIVHEDDLDSAPIQPRPLTRRPAAAAASVAGWRRRADFSALDIGDWHGRLRVLARDAAWYALHRPYVLQAIGLFIVIVAAAFVLSHVLGGRLFPNLWSMGASLGELTIEEAAAVLETTWTHQMKIQLVDSDRMWEVRPADLGLLLDAEATVEAARAAGMAGIPMGYNVLPVVSLDEFAAQDYLLNLTDEANFAPRNASFAWQNNELVGVPGTFGRVLDVGMSMEVLKENLVGIVDARRFELVMQPLEPAISDPNPYLEDARALLSRPFELNGYDPFRNEFMRWSTDGTTLATWLEVNDQGLGLREDQYMPFLEAQNESLMAVNELRYLEPTETMEKIELALQEGASRVDLRIRYRPTEYTVQPGDTGYRIARRTGLPFYLITTANPGMEWDTLSIGDVVRIPSIDATVPLDPVPSKRIIVNLDTQSLIAYEDGVEVFSWRISSGVAEFPTYPGVYQILTQDETAFGSTFELCGTNGCGQWEMYWFMGIYEVVPGLMNGFHGAVLLPNGAYLGGGNVGYPYTYGCVMSENSNAEKLFRWADLGTVVEIVSEEYASPSDLGQNAFTTYNPLQGHAAF
jgi:hypothetical protein